MITTLHHSIPRYANQQQPTPPPPQQPPAPELPTTEEIYSEVDGMLVMLDAMVKEDPAVGAELRQASSQVKADFADMVKNTSALPQAAEQAREAALMALAGGLVAGGLDGILLMAADGASQVAAPAAEQAEPASIGEAIDRFIEELQASLQAAKQELIEAGKDALQEASAVGKTLGTAAVDESAGFVDAAYTPVLAYQSYLTGLFALGYGVGATDAAIITVAGEVPGQGQQQQAA